VNLGLLVLMVPSPSGIWCYWGLTQGIVLSSLYVSLLLNSTSDLYLLTNLVDLVVVLPFSCHSQVAIYLSMII